MSLGIHELLGGYWWATLVRYSGLSDDADAKSSSHSEGLAQVCEQRKEEAKKDEGQRQEL